MIAQVTVQDADQDGRDGDDADRAVGAVLETACLIGPAGAGPGGAAAGTSGGEDDRPAPVYREDEILAAKGDGLFRAQRRVVQAAEERGQFRPEAGDLAQDRPDLRRAGDRSRVDSRRHCGCAPAPQAETTLDVDAILVNIGFRADLGPIKDWGLQIDGREIRANGSMETSIPGVFAAGDIAGPQGGVKLNLIATGYAQAALAVNVAKAFVDPTSKIFPGHSSEMKK